MGVDGSGSLAARKHAVTADGDDLDGSDVLVPSRPLVAQHSLQHRHLPPYRHAERARRPSRLTANTKRLGKQLGLAILVSIDPANYSLVNIHADAHCQSEKVNGPPFPRTQRALHDRRVGAGVGQTIADRRLLDTQGIHRIYTLPILVGYVELVIGINRRFLEPSHELLGEVAGFLTGVGGGVGARSVAGVAITMARTGSRAARLEEPRLVLAALPRRAAPADGRQCVVHGDDEQTANRNKAHDE